MQDYVEDLLEEVVMDQFDDSDDIYESDLDDCGYV